MQGNRQERRRGSYGESSSVPRKAEWDHVTKPKWGKVRRRSQVVKAKCISNCRMLVPEALWREQKEVRTWRRSRNHNFDVPHRILCGAWVSWLAVLRAMKRVKADITEIGEAKKKNQAQWYFIPSVDEISQDKDLTMAGMCELGKYSGFLPLCSLCGTITMTKGIQAPVES